MRYLLLARWLAIGALPACGGGGEDRGGPSPISVIVKLGGDEQTDTVGQVLAESLKVLVTRGNAPRAGATVTWEAFPTEGTLSPVSVATDANGLAASQWTLSTGIGVRIVTARVADAPEASVSFSAIAKPDAPASLAMVSGNNQSAMVNTPLKRIRAAVVDQFENGVPGVPVSWSVSEGVADPATDITDPSGISLVTVTLGSTPGPVTITASVTGVPPLVFSATAQPIPATAAVLVGNNFFTSDRNSSSNPAVDTVAVGATVDWTWVNTGQISQRSLIGQSKLHQQRYEIRNRTVLLHYLQRGGHLPVRLRGARSADDRTHRRSLTTDRSPRALPSSVVNFFL